MKLLLIEDEEDLVSALSLGLRKKGYLVDVALDGQEGLDLCTINNYNLVILDLNLPSLDGLEILSEIRKTNQTLKIIILSARSTFEERIVGLDLGANDYLIKPFNFGELEARIRSLLRRQFIQQDTIVTNGKLVLNTLARTISFDNTPMTDLTPKEFSILEYLLLHQNQVISAERLIEHIWESDTDLFSNAIKVHMSTLRKKIGLYCSDEVISNVRGMGYVIKERNDNHV